MDISLKEIIIHVHDDRESTAEIPKVYFEWLLEQSERSQELEEQLEKERRVRKYLREKHDIYKRALQEAEGCTDVPASVIIRKALEGEE